MIFHRFTITNYNWWLKEKYGEYPPYDLIDAGKKDTDVHYNYQYILNNTNHCHTYVKYTN